VLQAAGPPVPKALAAESLEFIARLYRIEKEPVQELSVPELYELRQQRPSRSWWN